ncbi:MAG: tetratricopeptide repeat protein, partial [Ginsengibacter sp.]
MSNGENTNPVNKVAQSLSALSVEALNQIKSNLSTTLWLGIATGFVGIAGYSLSLQKMRWETLFLSILLASASYISGFFLGFLFGIPKRNADKESAYNLSTNLVDISDWLTKIIIGLGLIEIKRIPGYLESIGVYIQKETNGENSMKIFSVCVIIYFSIFGLYYGYNYMRLFLSGQFKEADDNLLQKQIKLSQTGEVLNNQDLSPDNLDESAKEKLKEYNQLLKTTKIEADYTFDDWYYKGISAYNTQDYNKTIVYMNNALEKDSKSPNAPDAYLYIGLAYIFLKIYDQALEANNKIIKNYKDYSYLYLAHHNNGVAYDNMGSFQKALGEFESAVTLNRSYTDSWNGKGYALINLHRYEDAIKALDEATAINPDDPNPWYNKATADAALKN